MMRLLGEIRNYMGSYQVKSGVYHYNRREFGQAVSFLRKALADDAQLASAERRDARRHLTLALKGLGQKLAADGEVEAGIAELAEAARVDPDYPDVHYVRASLLERVERPQEAIEAYRRAIECHPGYLDAHGALGRCLMDVGRTAEAAEVLRRALALKLEHVQGSFREGLRLLEAGEVQAARECFHEAFHAVPQRSQECLEQAVEWLRADEHERALAELDLALTSNPKYPDVHNLRGVALLELERFDEAFVAFKRSAELCPTSVVPRLNLAFALLRAGRVEEGEAELQAILERDGTEPVARAKLEELRAMRPAEKRGPAPRS